MRLSEVSASVGDSLRSADLKVSDFVPAKIVPPLVIIGTGDPYLEEAGTFADEVIVYLELFCVVGTSTNSAATAALNDMIQTVLFNVGDWDIVRVSAPYVATANDAYYLTSKIEIKNNIGIGD